MTDDEIADFIATQKSLQVATLMADGSPHLSTLWFDIVDGDIVFETYTSSQKVVNLRRDPRITVLVEDGDTYDQLRGVSIRGVAELHTDPEVVHRLACGWRWSTLIEASWIYYRRDGRRRQGAGKRTGLKSQG